MSMNNFSITIVLLLITFSAMSQPKDPIGKHEPGTYWGTNVYLTPFRLPLPDKDVKYIDLDNDGDPDVLQATINGKLKVQWIDDDDDMKKGDLEGDTDSDCLMIDRNGDGQYGADYDLMIDWGDENGDNKADIQVIVDNQGWLERRQKFLNHYMIFVDTDKDGVFNYIDWNKFLIEAWDHEGRCNFFPDYNGQSLFLKAHNQVSDIEDPRYNWENPFLFYDFDNDGLTEMTIRFVDENSVPRKERATRNYGVKFKQSVVGVYMGIDLDNDSHPGNELDFDMSLKFEGEGFDYSNHTHKFNCMRGLPDADKFFKDPRWRQLTELKYVGHETAYNEIFDKGEWNSAAFVFDEDDDCQRWERVEFYSPLNPFNVGSRNGGLDNNPQADVSGDRGEWDKDFSGKGNLYIAPFDGRLHLLGAELGYWRIDQFATYFQGWQGWRGPSLAPNDMVEMEPGKFATVKYTDEDNNGFIDQIKYDLDGDTIYETTVNLKELGISDKAKIIETKNLSYFGYQTIFSEMADGLWKNAETALQIAEKYNLNTNWYSFMKKPKSVQQKYEYGFWISFYIHKDLLQLSKRNGDNKLATNVMKAYYSSNWKLLLK